MGMGHRARNSLVLGLPFYLVVIAVVCLRGACLMISGPYSDGGDDDEEDDTGRDAVSELDSMCDLQDCLELYQAAQEALHINYGAPRHRPGGSQGSDTRARCEGLRTFFLCIQNMSRSCLGDLIFHSSYRVVEKQMKSLNCSRQGPVFRPPVAIPPRVGGSLPVVTPPDNLCSYKGQPERCYCAAFGDPHLWTFDGMHQTCRMIGAWPLVNNDYLSIQVTSESLGSGGGTAVAKVTVVIKQHHECTPDHYITYQATSPDPLPGTFDNGATSFGTSEAVRLTDVVAGRHVEIVLRHVDTLVVIRQLGRHYSVGIRTPTYLAQSLPGGDADIQLCVSRCPVAERLGINAAMKLSSPSLADAVEICRRHKLVDFFLDACVFDLVASGGDRNFSMTAAHALQDFLRLNPAASRQLHNRTNFVGIPTVNSVLILKSERTFVYLMVLLTASFIMVSLWTTLYCPDIR